MCAGPRGAMPRSGTPITLRPLPQAELPPGRTVRAVCILQLREGTSRMEARGHGGRAARHHAERTFLRGDHARGGPPHAVPASRISLRNRAVRRRDRIGGRLFSRILEPQRDERGSHGRAAREDSAEQGTASSRSFRSTRRSQPSFVLPEELPPRYCTRAEKIADWRRRNAHRRPTAKDCGGSMVEQQLVQVVFGPD
jgi:hypothetical protein